ncbi:MAG: methylmalonyl-CoA mutase family protein, partial [Phycisphaerae bacterium]
HQVEVDQVERLTSFKKRRNIDEVNRALDAIRAACRGQRSELRALEGGTNMAGAVHATNVMPALVNGALANCTMGEMVQAMADIYGRYSGGPEW